MKDGKCVTRQGELFIVEFLIEHRVAAASQCLDQESRDLVHRGQCAHRRPGDTANAWTISDFDIVVERFARSPAHRKIHCGLSSPREPPP